MPQSPRTHRAAEITQDGVNFQAPPSSQDPASIRQGSVSSFSRLPSLSFSLILSKVPVCSLEQCLCCQFKEVGLQKNEIAGAPTPPPVFPLAVCRSSSQVGEERPSRVVPHAHHWVLIKVFCAASSTICSHCLLAETWQGNACWFSF